MDKAASRPEKVIIAPEPGRPPASNTTSPGNVAKPALPVAVTTSAFPPGPSNAAPVVQSTAPLADDSRKTARGGAALKLAHAVRREAIAIFWA
jgi:hypothetical protein